MPFTETELRFDLMCRRDADGHWHGTIAVNVDAAALRRLGLHPGQPASVVTGVSPPAWWHAAGERYAARRESVRRHGK
ncbi:hypothetical protein [Streptomyces cyanogenus]|uniref:Uncharacterized protein n=1 Tax=Streptomyces cyanogenus TaxID=80860 RepID=A0ABX7U0D4_STRCY|nr:hypothetical protein [Streptomyces cyanogenus]QTE01102.1 hypothetical protein S1361_27465 [Streptomyces cyanogenus]